MAPRSLSSLRCRLQQTQALHTRPHSTKTFLRNSHFCFKTEPSPGARGAEGPRAARRPPCPDTPPPPHPAKRPALPYYLAFTAIQGEPGTQREGTTQEGEELACPHSRCVAGWDPYPGRSSPRTPPGHRAAWLTRRQEAHLHSRPRRALPNTLEVGAACREPLPTLPDGSL